MLLINRFFFFFYVWVESCKYYNRSGIPLVVSRWADEGFVAKMFLIINLAQVLQHQSLTLKVTSSSLMAACRRLNELVHSQLKVNINIFLPLSLSCVLGGGGEAWYVCLYVCMYVCVCMCVCVYVCVLCVCVCVCVYIYIYIYIYVCVYVSVCVYLFVCVWNDWYFMATVVHMVG